MLTRVIFYFILFIVIYSWFNGLVYYISNVVFFLFRIIKFFMVCYTEMFSKKISFKGKQNITLALYDINVPLHNIKQKLKTDILEIVNVIRIAHHRIVSLFYKNNS